MNGGGGGFPIGSMSANIICLSKDPFLTQILHPMTPLLTTVYAQWPLFFSKFQRKISIFQAFPTFYQFSTKNGFYPNMTHFYARWMTPFIGSSHPKGRFLANTQWSPFFYSKYYIERPLFRSQVCTYPSYSYSSAPSPRNESQVEFVLFCFCNLIWDIIYFKKIIKAILLLKKDQTFLMFSMLYS